MHFWKPWKINSLYSEKTNGQAFRSAEVQRSAREFPHCLDFTVFQRIFTWKEHYQEWQWWLLSYFRFFLSDMVKTSSLLHLHKFWRALDQSDQITSCWLMFQPQGMASIHVLTYLSHPLWSGASTKVFSTLSVTSLTNHLCILM